MNQQTDLNFGQNQATDPLLAWREQRRQAHIVLARKLGLPIDHEVELWLRGEVRLRGILRMKENLIIVPDENAPDLVFEVAGVTFSVAEMESCVRLD